MREWYKFCRVGKSKAIFFRINRMGGAASLTCHKGRKKILSTPVGGINLVHT